MVLRLIQQIISLFIMMGMGYLVVKLNFLQPTDSRILSRISVYLIMPCVNINAFQIAYTPEILTGFLTAITLSIMLHILLLILCHILGKYFHMRDVERLSIIYPNAGNLVIPLVTVLFGGEWVIYASAFMSTQLFCQWTHAQSVMSGQTSFNWKKILTNINLLTVLGGLLMFLLKVKLPAVGLQVVSSMSALIGPISMIMIGMMIAGTPVARIVKNKRIYIVVLMRLIVVPLLAMTFLRFAGTFINIENEKTILTIVFLALITPTSATTSQLSQFYNNEVEYCSAINVMTTLFCIITMPLMFALFVR